MSLLTLLRRIALLSLLICVGLHHRTAAGAIALSAWGNNSAGQTSPPPGLVTVSAIAGGGAHSLAINSNHVVAWGANQFGQSTVPAAASNAFIKAIAAGNAYSLALTTNGTVIGWGQTSVPAGLTNVTAIAAGFNHSLALLRNHTVVAWGTQTTVPADLTNIIAIAAGNGNNLALRDDYTVVGWGDNSFGKTNVPDGLTNVISIACGQDHCLALRRDGSLVAWGDDSYGQIDIPASATNIVAISAGALHNVVLRQNGFLVRWGDNFYGQSTMPGASNFFAIACGAYHTLALRGEGGPTIQAGPFDQAVVISHDATFQVLASGAPPLRYQWFRNGAPLSNATNSVLTVTNVQDADGGTYTALVINNGGSALSSGATLTPLGLKPFFISSPVSQSVLCGDTATFSAVLGGSLPLSYQWFFGSSPLPDATNADLILPAVTTNVQGAYTLVVANPYGSTTSAIVTLEIIPEPPIITSPLLAFGKQGDPFTYATSAQHAPSAFGVTGLPPGLTLDPLTGIISGTPTENGTFGPKIYAYNACASDVEILVLSFDSSVPRITSALTTSGREGRNFTYQIAATESPSSFGAIGLPLGLRVNPLTGIISGRPVYAATTDATITASNQWGVGSSLLHFTITNAIITGLSITNVTTNYASPYLLDIQFSLRDNTNSDVGNAIVTEPRFLTATCFEDNNVISSNETAVIIQKGSSRLFKSELVLDFSQSIASLSYGDTNNDGISDAVDAMVAGAIDFVDQQQNGAQVGVWEFHREDMAPARVSPLTTDKPALDAAIAGIWTNYVQWFPASSIAWDTLLAAIPDLGPTNRDEEHYLIFVSDGSDQSSLATVDDVITAATNAGVKIFCIGFGTELDPAPLQQITTETGGRYYDATTLGGLTPAFDQIGKDLNGQYVLRWATLKRSNKPFQPSFQIKYQAFTADSPPNPYFQDTNNPVVNTNTTPPTTNFPFVTNYIISPYTPSEHTGSVTVGSLRVVPNAATGAEAMTLRAFYVPRFIRQLRIHYRANWPCTTTLLSTNLGEILYNWSMSETNDDIGGRWLTLSNPNPASFTNSIPFGAFGNLVQFNLRDLTNPSNAFSLFTVDNTIYTNTGGQSFVIENTNSFLAPFTNLPHATPIPWLISHGFTNNFESAETADPDGDGATMWQEYQANTDPNDANSVFKVSALAQGIDGRFQITFPTTANRHYRIFSSLDLLNWDLVDENLSAVNGDYTYIDTRYLGDLSQIYYRVEVY